MSILQKILAQLNICRIVTVFSAVLLTSASSLSAGCFELNSNVNLDFHEILVNQMEYNGVEKDIAGTMYGFLKSGLSLVRKNPLKALTIFLAMQAQGSSFSVPGASAQFRVSNTNQTHLFDISDPNPVLQLSPMAISGVVTPCNATIVLSDINAGNLRSTDMGLSQKFDTGVWTSQGDGVALNRLLSNLQVLIAGGYNRAFNLSVEVYDLYFPSLNRVGGTIQVMPTGVGTTTSQVLTSTNPTATITQTTTRTTSSAPTTSKNTAVTTTRSNTTQLVISTTSAVTSAASSSLSNNQDSTESTASFPVSSMPNSPTTLTRVLTSASTTDTLSPTETIQVPLVGPEGEPPYAIIGGVLGGAVACTGVIALVVAAKRGLLCGGGKNSAAEEAHDPEKAVNKSEYGKIQVPSGGGYEVVVMPNTYDKPVPPAHAGQLEYDVVGQAVAPYGNVPAEKSPYEATHMPLN